MPAAALNGSAAAAGLPGRAAAAADDTHSNRLQLHYRTTWSAPVLHHSIAGSEWRGVPLQKVVSGGGWWHAANLHIDAAAAVAGSNGSSGGAAAAALLEFVLTDGQDAWDKAPDGGNYRISAPGRWKLADGALAAVDRPPAVLVVSDLDDTMIGDDAATAAFSAWWREEGVAAGGRLVYNTGRALDLFEALLADKAGVLAEPDALISAIGTRVYEK